MLERVTILSDVTSGKQIAKIASFKDILTTRNPN